MIESKKICVQYEHHTSIIWWAIFENAKQSCVSIIASATVWTVIMAHIVFWRVFHFSVGGFVIIFNHCFLHVKDRRPWVLPFVPVSFYTLAIFPTGLSFFLNIVRCRQTTFLVFFSSVQNSFCPMSYCHFGNLDFFV